MSWLNAVGNKREYIEKVRLAVERLHDCSATHSGTVPVHELFRGKTVWEGDVEVFDLEGHPKAKRAYAWSHADGPRDTEERFHAVLEIPPVDSAKNAVKVAIVADSKRIKGN